MPSTLTATASDAPRVRDYLTAKGATVPREAKLLVIREDGQIRAAAAIDRVARWAVRCAVHAVDQRYRLAMLFGLLRLAKGRAIKRIYFDGDLPPVMRRKLRGVRSRKADGSPEFYLEVDVAIDRLKTLADTDAAWLQQRATMFDALEVEAQAEFLAEISVDDATREARDAACAACRHRAMAGDAICLRHGILIRNTTWAKDAACDLWPDYQA